MEDTMGDCLQRYASHHNDTGTDKTTSHAYGPLYTELFAPLRTRARTVLEIGVYSGASVAAFADYFSEADVHGIDITLDRVRFAKDHPRVRYHLMDGTLPETASALGLTWDLVLDDASHTHAHQIASFKAFAPYIAPDGLYVIEDIDARDPVATAALRGALQDICDANGLQPLQWYDLRHIKGQFDDVVAVATNKVGSKTVG